MNGRMRKTRNVFQLFNGKIRMKNFQTDNLDVGINRIGVDIEIDNKKQFLKICQLQFERFDERVVGKRKRVEERNETFKNGNKRLCLITRKNYEKKCRQGATESLEGLKYQ